MRTYYHRFAQAKALTMKRMDSYIKELQDIKDKLVKEEGVVMIDEKGRAVDAYDFPCHGWPYDILVYLRSQDIRTYTEEEVMILEGVDERENP
ncbi:MAG: hypothetical protein ACRCVN_06175 [Spirochaetia bacterium]